MAMTSVAPMTIPQINRYYYVGEPSFDTIQETVTFAVSDGNFGAVIIPEGYAGGDSITAVTGGSATIIIVDERDGQRQAYFWFNNAYIYQSIHSRGGVLTPQLNNYAFVGFGVHPTIQEVIDNFATLPALTITIIVEPSYTGDEVIGELVNGDTGIIIADLRTAQWQNYTWDGTNFVPADFVPEGAIIANSITADSISSGTIEAQDATFEDCLVGDSPVRTFANTADSPSQGMIWPTLGIPVSLGDHWQDPSINPASLAGWPPIGVPVSTGTAWGASIPANTIPRLDASGNLTIVGAVNVMANANGQPVNATNGGMKITWNIGLAAETDFINARTVGPGSGGFYWYNVDANTPVTQTTPWVMAIEGNGDLFVPATTHLASLLIGPRANGTPWQNGPPNINADNAILSLNAGDSGDMYMQWDNGTGRVNIGNGNGGGNLTLDGAAGSITMTGPLQTNSYVEGYGFTAIGVAPVISGSARLAWGSNTTTLDSFGSGGGRGTIHLRVSSAGAANLLDALGIDASGDAAFFGSISAGGAKNFKITHPLDDTKLLTHSCIEGPEIALFYRGEAITQNGKAEVTLPDYFEALTLPYNRSVLLTQIFEDDDDVVIGSNSPTMLEASRVKDGKFRIRSTNPTVKVYWEVKALRGDIPQIEVATLKETDNAQLIPQPILHPANDAGVVGDRTSEAGESQPQKVRAGDAANTGSNRARKSHKGA